MNALGRSPLLLVPLPGNEDITYRLARLIAADICEIETRRFPDGETYLRFPRSPKGRSVALVCTLDRPDPKFLPLVFAAAAARQLGARRIGLVAPYLCYLRQDRSFHPGEAITSATFARALSADIDWLVTVDPHLHRYGSLDAVYTVPSRVVAAAPAIAGWVSANVPRPVVIGPDSESEQWVATVARLCGAPYKVLDKERLGDRTVRIRVPDLSRFADRTPVLVDDIASSAKTMIEAARQLDLIGMSRPVCIAVHALFTSDGFAELRDQAAAVVTCNTVAHESNAIDVAPNIAAEVRGFIAPVTPGHGVRPKADTAPTGDEGSVIR